MSKVLLATAVVVAFVSPAQAAAKKAKTPEQACQAQALASIAREWPNVLHGTFEIILKGNRCLVLLQAPAVFEDKRAARLLDGKTGVLLSEFYGPKDSNRPLHVSRRQVPVGRVHVDRVLGESQPDVKSSGVPASVLALPVASASRPVGPRTRPTERCTHGSRL